MLCRAILGTLHRHDARVSGGTIHIQGRDASFFNDSDWHRLRGTVLGYVSQASLAGLNPTLTVRRHLVHAARAVMALDTRSAERCALEAIEMVELPRANRILDEYPSQLSGGMRQRVVIASALLQRPKLLVADEPTTALDVTVQKSIMDLLVRLTTSLGMSLVLVTHDLALVEEYTNEVVVLYAGATVEAGRTGDVLNDPRHPYTQALQSSRLRLGDKKLTSGMWLPGAPPQPGEWPQGCRFTPRCPHAQDVCSSGGQPRLEAVLSVRRTACIRSEEVFGT